MLPETLKHYTSIDTLEKILESRRIRFSRFDKMDDQTEIEGLPELIKKSYFLSCWIDEKRESIPQWKMYAEKGVRIELTRKWYKRHPIIIGDVTVEVDKLPLLGNDHIAKDMLFILPYQESFGVNQKYYIAPPLNEEHGLIVKVEYTESFLDIKQMCWSENAKGAVEVPGLFYPIKFKDTYWSFQNEYRYYMFANTSNEDRNFMPIFFDVPINDKALNQIKIVLYPNCTEDDKTRVEDILRKHLPDIDFDNQIQRSELDGKLR